MIRNYHIITNIPIDKYTQVELVNICTFNVKERKSEMGTERKLSFCILFFFWANSHLNVHATNDAGNEFTISYIASFCLSIMDAFMAAFWKFQTDSKISYSHWKGLKGIYNFYKTPFELFLLVHKPCGVCHRTHQLGHIQDSQNSNGSHSLKETQPVRFGWAITILPSYRMKFI